MRLIITLLKQIKYHKAFSRWERFRGGPHTLSLNFKSRENSYTQYIPTIVTIPNDCKLASDHFKGLIKKMKTHTAYNKPDLVLYQHYDMN